HALHRMRGGAPVPGLAREVALGTLQMLGLALLGVVLAFAASRLRPNRIVRALTLLVVLGVGAWAYERTLEPPSACVDFFGLRTLPPMQRWNDDRDPARPARLYSVNRHGLRGGDFEIAKRPGVLRIAAIGDSFTFGMGVGDDDTIPARIAAHFRERGLGDRVEVLNLGVCGNNLGSYLEMYRVARQRLAADVFLVGVVPSHDLGTWDWQHERRDSPRVSAYSLARFLLGSEQPSYVLNVWNVQHTSSDAPGPSLEPQLAPFDRDRAHDGAPPALFFAFGLVPDLGPNLRRRANVSFMPVDLPREFYIAGDGHPNERGTAATSERLILWLERLPEVRALAIVGR
ncbi:MAG: SGNH/GDSL hydrolase family protein, partial [Deltaproteobacteria bacterium]